MPANPTPTLADIEASLKEAIADSGFSRAARWSVAHGPQLIARIRAQQEALETIGKAYDEWNPDGNFASTILAKVPASPATPLKERDDAHTPMLCR